MSTEVDNYYLKIIEKMKVEHARRVDERRAEIRELEERTSKIKKLNTLWQEINAARAQAIALAKMTYYERFCRITHQNPFYIPMEIIRLIALAIRALFIGRFFTNVYFLLIATVALIAFNFIAFLQKEGEQTKERSIDRIEIPIVTPKENVDEILDELASIRSFILRTESQDRKREKMAAQNKKIN